jgi:hypothetical protein
MFAQSIYLIFSSVYVCKETVEHLLLSAGEDIHHHAGHHHHAQGYVPSFIIFVTSSVTFITSIGLPLLLTLLTLMSLIGTAFAFENHAKLVQSVSTITVVDY